MDRCILHIQWFGFRLSFLLFSIWSDWLTFPVLSCPFLVRFRLFIPPDCLWQKIFPGMWKYFRAIRNCSAENPLDDSCLESNMPELLGCSVQQQCRQFQLYLPSSDSPLPVTGSQQAIDDKVSHFSAQLLSRGEVEEEMLAGEDAA
jgi:hypothetical protein